MASVKEKKKDNKIFYSRKKLLSIERIYFQIHKKFIAIYMYYML